MRGKEMSRVRRDIANRGEAETFLGENFGGGVQDVIDIGVVALGGRHRANLRFGPAARFEGAMADDFFTRLSLPSTPEFCPLEASSKRDMRFTMG